MQDEEALDKVSEEPIVCHSLRRILNKQSCQIEEAFDVDAAMQKTRLNIYSKTLRCRNETEWRS